MKRTITQYVMLGVMLLLLVLIVSMYPDHSHTNAIGHKEAATKVSKLSVQTRAKSMRSD